MKNNNLMVLVNEAIKTVQKKKFELDERLFKEAGLTKAAALVKRVKTLDHYALLAKEFPRITSGMIDSYLKRIDNRPDADIFTYRCCCFIFCTCDIIERRHVSRSAYVWTEYKLKNYGAIPPRHVIERLKEVQNKKIFDYFTIASVEKIKDPLLLGRFKDSSDRFFIAQWGEDIALDDII